MDAKLNQFEVTAEELDQYPGQEFAGEVSGLPLPTIQIDQRNQWRFGKDDDATGVK